MAWNNPSGYMRPGQEQPRLDSQAVPTGSWYPPQSFPHFRTPDSSSITSSYQRTSDQPNLLSCGQASPDVVAAVVSGLKGKSTDEVRKLLTDTEEYDEFFKSLDLAKDQYILHDEIREEVLQLASHILEKEPSIEELRSQCVIIRTTELAAAQEKIKELELQKEDTLKLFSSESLVKKLQDAAHEIKMESEALEQQLLGGNSELSSFVQNYKSLRTIYHRRCLLHLAAKSCL